MILAAVRAASADADHLTGWDVLGIAVLAAFILALMWIISR